MVYQIRRECGYGYFSELQCERAGCQFSVWRLVNFYCEKYYEWEENLWKEPIIKLVMNIIII